MDFVIGRQPRGPIEITTEQLETGSVALKANGATVLYLQTDGAIKLGGLHPQLLADLGFQIGDDGTVKCS